MDTHKNARLTLLRHSELPESDSNTLSMRKGGIVRNRPLCYNWGVLRCRILEIPVRMAFESLNAWRRLVGGDRRRLTRGEEPCGASSGAF